MCYKGNIKARSLNYCWRGKAIGVIYSECVSVALIFHYAKLTRHIILSSVTCPALPHFFTLSHKRRDIRKKLLNIKCVF